MTNHRFRVNTIVTTKRRVRTDSVRGLGYGIRNPQGDRANVSRASSGLLLAGRCATRHLPFSPENSRVRASPSKIAAPHCNASRVSAFVESGGKVWPCFFHSQNREHWQDDGIGCHGGPSNASISPAPGYSSEPHLPPLYFAALRGPWQHSQLHVPVCQPAQQEDNDHL